MENTPLRLKREINPAPNNKDFKVAEIARASC